MRDSFIHKNHLCLVFELLSSNLYELIKANSFAGFSTRLIRRFTSQVLASLSLLRHQRVVHCDLKPENILLNFDGHIKIADFGFAKYCTTTVWTLCGTPDYLAPEVSV